MSDQTSFRRIAAISAIFSMPLSLAALAIVTLAVDFNLEMMSDQAALIALDEQAAATFHLGEMLGVFGNYLLLVPVALYLWHWLKSQNPNLVSLYTVSGLGFIFIGVPGAIIRANVMPEMMRTYALASGPEREMLAVAFNVLTDAVFAGLGVLELILVGVWWFGIGLVLQRKQRFLGVFTATLGVASLLAGAGTVFHIEVVAALEGITWLVFPFWILWLGIVIARRAEMGERLPAPATAA